MAKRHRSHRLVKIHRSYTVEEASILLGVHRNTVREWIKRGLTPIVSEYDETAVRVGDRPFLVALKTAINTRKARELARRFGGRLTERRIDGALVIRAMR